MVRSRDFVLVLFLSLSFPATSFSAPLSENTSSDAVIQKINLNVSFGQISDVLKTQIDAAIDSEIRRIDCDKVGTSEDKRPEREQYSCGEVPFGSIVNDNDKQILDIKINAMNGTKSDVRYSIGGGRLRVYLSRNQLRGRVDLNSLTESKIVSFATSPRLGDDVFFRFTPTDGLLRNRVCFVTPALKVDADALSLDGQITKIMPWYLPDLHSRVMVRIDPGASRLGSASLCADLETIVDDHGRPKVMVKKISAPSRIELSETGLNVKAAADVGGFWGLLAPLLKAFGYDIEKMIAAEVKKAAVAAARSQIEISTADVRNGAWFRKYVDGISLGDLSKRITDRAAIELENAGLGKSSVDTAVQSTCLAAVAKQNLPKPLKKQLAQLCILSPKVKVELFLRDAEMAAKGCYARFTTSREMNSSAVEWWRSECAIKNRVSITISARLKPVFVCLIDAWNSRRNPSAECMNAMNNFTLDLTSGRLDDLIAELKTVKPKLPTAEELAAIRKLVKEQLGIQLPKLDDLFDSLL